MNTVSVSRKTLEEWALCLSQGDISPRWEIEALLTQPEQPAVSVKEGWEFTRWSGNSPDAVKNAAMEVARLVYYRQREWPRREWGDIGQLETYSIAQLAKVIYPVLRDAWPQAQPKQPAKITCHAKGERCYGCAHYRGEAGVCEFAEQPEAGRADSAEAVRLLRKVWHCRTGYGTDVCEMLAEDDYNDLCAEVETFLAQHGGRGDE